MIVTLNINIEDFPIIVIAGPTASGKSDFALQIAKELPCTIINFDSMQVYKDLKILTARPNEDQCKNNPHELYGFLNAESEFSAVLWRNLAVKKIKENIINNRVPLLVGGTGFYLKSLMDGFSSVPKSSNRYKIKAENELIKFGKDLFYEKIKKIEPRIEDSIAKNDTQRLIRFYSVWLQTGKSLTYYHNTEKFSKKFFKNFIKVRLCPDRGVLRKQISNRFYEMIDRGAIREVENLRDLNPKLPIMKAHGVRELLLCNEGKLSLEDASTRSINHIRQYAKRQDTWFKNQFESDYEIIDYKCNVEKHINKILNLYNKFDF